MKIKNETEFKAALNTLPNPVFSCVNCNLPFSDNNVFSPEGWSATQSKSLCEYCDEDITSFNSGDDCDS